MWLNRTGILNLVSSVRSLDMPACFPVQGLNLFFKAHGSAPDVVMLSSNFWDISKACVRPTKKRNHSSLLHSDTFTYSSCCISPVCLFHSCFIARDRWSFETDMYVNAQADFDALRRFAEGTVHRRFADGGYRFEGTPLGKELFPDEWMHAWIHNFTTILTQLKVSTP